MDSGRPVLELKSISKSFPGTRALDAVNLTVRAGEVVALLGENGAGKSTLMKILSGIWPSGSFEGSIEIDGKPVSFTDTRDAHAAGIAMIHQELSVFPELTVAEHLELDRLPSWIQWDEIVSRAEHFLEKLDFGLDSSARVGELSIGGRQLVEIARALYRDARVLVLDEPTSALTDSEVSRLYAIVERLRSEGHAIIYITHRLDEVFRLADRMVVLRDGRNAGELSSGPANARIPRRDLEPQLIQWMVGRSVEDIYPARNTRIGEEILRVEGLSVSTNSGKRLVDDLSFSVRRGEVLGLAGLLGAGRSETFEALFGVLNPAGPRGARCDVQGEVRLHGKDAGIDRPSQAIGARMAYVSEDRKASGLVLEDSVLRNATLPALSANRAGLTGGRSLLSFVDESEELEQAERWTRDLRLKASHLDQPVGELSGGNQQKAVLAKWLMTDPEILFLDEPTRGIDVGAKMEIYRWIQKLAGEGMAIVLASSEMPELLGLCHRIAVLREGRKSAEFMAGQVTQEDIMRAASL